MSASTLSYSKIEGPRMVIEPGDPRYPEAFERLKNPPRTLYVIGDPDVLAEEGVAIVGSRRATPYGQSCARTFAALTAERGIVQVSGGGPGVAVAAMESALSSGGRVVAILGGGLDHPYPAANVPLFQRIVDGGGALVSEHTWDFPATPHAFRARNRLIACLAKATLIVEAGMPSGTFSIADETLGAGREVLAVPGAITSVNSTGPNRLIAEGATPIVDESTYHDALERIFDLPYQVR